MQMDVKKEAAEGKDKITEVKEVYKKMYIQRIQPYE